MKRRLILLMMACSAVAIYAQVGINTTSPLVGLHVTPLSTDGSTTDGIIAPNLTRAQLITKDNRYTTAHKGAFVFITDIDGTATPKTENITTSGYYYFDGTVWKHFNDKLQNADNGLSVNNATVGLGGSLVRPTTINTNAQPLAITGTGATSITPKTTIGSNIASPSAAVLNLQTQADADPANGGVNANGGLMIPRVQLTETNSLKPFITSGGTAAEKASHKSLMVYHVGGNTIGAGLKFWDGTQWLNVITDIPPAPVITSNIHNLMEVYYCPNLGSTALDPMQFGTLQADGTYAIEIKEKGSYMFSLRLYGRSATLPAAYGNINFYTWLLADGAIIDAVEYPVTTSSYYYNPTTNQYSHYTGITLNLSAKDIAVGTKITIAMRTGRFMYITKDDNITTTTIDWYWNIGAGLTPVRSSLVYYKL